MGSGSASRSLAGGFVRWQAGEKLDGTDSIAVQVRLICICTLREGLVSPYAYVRMRSKAWLAARMSLRLARMRLRQAFSRMLLFDIK